MNKDASVWLKFIYNWYLFIHSQCLQVPGTLTSWWKGGRGEDSTGQAPLEKEGEGKARRLANASASLIYLELLQATSGSNNATGLLRVAGIKREKGGGAVLSLVQTTQELAFGG